MREEPFLKSHNQVRPSPQVPADRPDFSAENAEIFEIAEQDGFPAWATMMHLPREASRHRAGGARLFLISIFLSVLRA